MGNRIYEHQPETIVYGYFSSVEFGKPFCHLTSIKRSSIKHKSVLNIIPTKTHHRYRGVLSCWDFVKPNQVYSLKRKKHVQMAGKISPHIYNT